MSIVVHIHTSPHSPLASLPLLLAAWLSCAEGAEIGADEIVILALEPVGADASADAAGPSPQPELLESPAAALDDTAPEAAPEAAAAAPEALPLPAEPPAAPPEPPSAAQESPSAASVPDAAPPPPAAELDAGVPSDAAPADAGA